MNGGRIQSITGYIVTMSFLCDIFHNVSVANKIPEILLLLSNVVGDKNLRSYLAFKGFRKENQREVGKLDNATTDLQDNRI